MTTRDVNDFVHRFASRAPRLIVISSGDVSRACGRIWQTEAAGIDSAPLTEYSPLRRVL